MNNVIEKQAEALNRTRPVTRPHINSATRVNPRALRVIASGFVVVVIAAEAITMFMGVIPGTILYSILLISLVNLSHFSALSVIRRGALSFCLVPMLRILSLVMPIQLVSPLYQYIMTGIPLMLSTLLVMRANGLPSFRLNLTGLEWVYQIIIGISGLPLGVLAATFLVPSQQMVDTSNLLWMLSLWVAYTLFGAVMEEIIFRGLLQRTFAFPFGAINILLSSLLYASMFFGTLSPAYVIFYGLTGLLFSIWVEISNSLVGVIMAHSLMNIIFLLFFFLFR